MDQVFQLVLVYLVQQLAKLLPDLRNYMHERDDRPFQLWISRGYLDVRVENHWKDAWQLLQ